MFRWIAPVVGALLGLGALEAQAQACTQTINPGNDVTGTIAGMTSGQVLCLNAGNYTVQPGFPSNGSFAVGVGVIVRGLGATPAQVTLTANNAGDHALYFTNYLTTKNANGAQLINLTIQGSPGGVQIQNFTAAPAGRLTDIKLKDVVITTTAVAGPFFGMKTSAADRIVLDNVTITSHNTAINIIDTTDSLVMNSFVTNTVATSAAALSVLGGSGNRFVNSTFGQARGSAGAPYSFNGGGVVFYNTSDNRFEGNTLQGMQADALAYTIFDLSPNGLPLTKSLNNYAGRNLIIHSAFPINGLTAGSSGIWSNCGSDGTWVYGNTVTGSGEGGLTIFEGRNNMFLGNISFNHGLLGTYVSGDQTAMNDCTPVPGNFTFRQKPTNNFILSNANFYNPLENVVIRDADGTVLQRNFSSPTAGLGGPVQTCTFGTCQAAVSLETDGTAGRNTNTGTRLIANTSVGNQRGLWTQNTTPNNVTGLAFYLNRIIGSGSSLYESPVTHNIDGASVVGGNYWTNFSPTGNPSAMPYNGIAHNTGGGTGNVVDRFPFQSENLGRGYGVTIYEPRAGAMVSQGSQRTLRYNAPGCAYLDFTLNGVPVATNTPNTGYTVVTIPNVGAGTPNFVATCKDAAGVNRGTSAGPSFTTTGSLQIVSPGRDDVYNTSTSVWVAWSNPTHLTPVTIDVSTDGGASWTQVASIAGISATNRVTSTRVTTPAAGSANAIYRVRSGGSTATNCGGVTNCDEMDGVFALRAVAGAFDPLNVNAGRTWQAGAVERIEWSSPQTSRLVTLTATSSGGGGAVTIATDLPDRGFFDWVMPEFPIGTLSFTANFKTNTGAAVGAPVTIVNGGSIRRLQTITYGAIPTVVPGGNAPISVSTNAGQTVVLTSSTPGVCTVTGGNTINGIANGVCIITANAAGNANYAAASASVISFNVGLSQTITFNSTAYIGVTKSITLSATASSGLAVAFTSLTPGICTISGGNVLTANSSGTCTVAANQPGNGTYAAAPQVQRNLQAMATILLPRLANLSTRGFVGSGGDVMIAGLIIGGPTAKTVVVTVAGPSLSNAGIPNPLANPTLTLIRSSDGVVVGSNDNWQQAANAAAIQTAGFAPAHPAEPAVMMTLAPGAYTAIVQASGGVGTGIGLVGVYEVAEPEVPLINISTRGFVGTGNDVMIAGLIVQGSNTQSVVITVAGPSLAGAGIPNPLNNPMITIVRASDGVVIATNDNWQTQANPGDVATIQNAGFAPAHPNEPAVFLTLPPGAYTAIVQGVSNTTGVGLVGVYAVAQ